MARKTTLRPYALPGGVYSFVAKATVGEDEYSIILYIEQELPFDLYIRQEENMTVYVDEERAISVER